MDNEVRIGRVQWTSVQAYAFAAVCLVVGFTFGYLMHGSAKVAAVSTQGEQVQADAAQPPAMPSPDQLKHMGDKMAQPLLAKLKGDQNNPDTLAEVASVYFRAGQYPLAAEYYEKAVKAKPSAEGYVSLSNTYHYAGDDEKAIAMLNQALQIDPKSANALFNLGMLNWQVKKDPQAAIEAWQLLLKTNPKHPKRAQVENMISKAKQHLSMATANGAKPEM